MFNCGMLAIELPAAGIAKIFEHAGDTVSCTVDLGTKKLAFSWKSGSMEAPFGLSEFDEALVRAGGWVEFADAKY